ncbi:MAG: HTH-type transcriptional regulator CysB, partial [Oceanospirillales bacterium]|nr:HTH-type transcriptional regulator CysB [Oceanospirillales bacterium]
LVALDACRLFGQSVLWIGFCKVTCLSGYMYDFIQTFAPHLTPDLVRQVQACGNRHDVDALFADMELPEH